MSDERFNRRIGVQLNEYQSDALRELAEARGMTITGLVRELIDRELLAEAQRLLEMGRPVDELVPLLDDQHQWAGEIPAP